MEQMLIAHGCQMFIVRSPWRHLCLHRLTWDTICLKDGISVPTEDCRVFQVWILITTYFNSSHRSGFWHRRSRCLLSKPPFPSLLRDACHRSFNLHKSTHIGTSLLWVNIASFEKQNCKGNEEDALWSDDPAFFTHVLGDLGQVISCIWASHSPRAEGGNGFLSWLLACIQLLYDSIQAQGLLLLEASPNCFSPHLSFLLLSL